jgi:hypothetical protein
MGFLRRIKRKGRRYAIKRDEWGTSARARCFEMFEEGVPLPEISRTVGVPLKTVYTYHSQWKRAPHLEVRLAYMGKLLNARNPERECNLALLAQALGIDKEQIETVLSQPYGLKRLATGKLYFPGHQEQDHRRHIALELALFISDHLINGGVEFEDVYNALGRFMKEYRRRREEEDEDIKENNDRIALMRRIIQVDLENERRNRVQSDRLSPEEREVVRRWGIDRAKKKLEVDYWLRISEIMAEGMTEEQAREKIYRDLVDKGDIEGAKLMRQYQDHVHPLAGGGTLPKGSPTEAAGNDKKMGNGDIKAP